jgi:hypothetical protein
MNNKLKAMLSSWLRSFIAAALALYTAGETDPKVLLNAGLAAVVPVVLRYVNKKDPAFGLVAKIALDEAVKATAPKKTAKKTAKAKN